MSEADVIKAELPEEARWIRAGSGFYSLRNTLIRPLN